MPHARCATAQSRRGICASHSEHSPYKERPDCCSTYVQCVCMQSSHDNPRISKKSATYPHYIKSYFVSTSALWGADLPTAPSGGENVGFVGFEPAAGAAGGKACRRRFFLRFFMCQRARFHNTRDTAAAGARPMRHDCTMHAMRQTEISTRKCITSSKLMILSSLDSQSHLLRF